MSDAHHGNGNGNGNGTEPLLSKAQARSLTIAGAGLIAYLVLVGLTFATQSGGEHNHQRFGTSWLVASVFWVAIPIGSMVMLMIQYLTGGKWGVLLRRPFEAASRTLPVVMLAFIPVVILYFLDPHHVSPYWWAGEGGPNAHTDDLKAKAAEWLTPSFAAARTVGYFVFWLVLMALLNGWSRRHETEGDEAARTKLHDFSGPALMAHSVVLTLAATDWVMSLEPTWASTMFPVILGVTQLLSAYTFNVVVLLWLSQGPLKNVLKPVPHQIDLGSFMQAFTMFWTYISFSQFMLVWVANLPEEIPYYLKRTKDGWEWLAFCLLIFHFFLPFFLLLQRDIKQNRKALASVAVILLFTCCLDTVFWVEAVLPHTGVPLFPFMDVAAVLTLGGVFGWAYFGQLKKGTLLPTREAQVLTEAHH